jgi:KTSC domain
MAQRTEEKVMNRDPVSSSNLASVGYDEQSQTLEVEFAGGSVYQYYNVGKELFDQFMTAPSKGQFLSTYIRNAYPFSRIG